MIKFKIEIDKVEDVANLEERVRRSILNRKQIDALKVLLEAGYNFGGRARISARNGGDYTQVKLEFEKKVFEIAKMNGINDEKRRLAYRLVNYAYSVGYQFAGKISGYCSKSFFRSAFFNNFVGILRILS